jgi:hypothetical protein
MRKVLPLQKLPWTPIYEALLYLYEKSASVAKTYSFLHTHFRSPPVPWTPIYEALLYLYESFSKDDVLA